MQYSSWSNLKVRSFHDSKRLIQSLIDLANAKRRSSKEDLRGKEREGIRVSLPLSSPSMKLFSMDWRRWRCGHFLALWTAKKLWTLVSAKLDQAWPRSVERNRNRKPIWRITSGSVSRLPFCLTDLFMRSPNLQCFFFAPSSSLSLSLFLLAFEEKWNLEAGPIPFEIKLGTRMCESSVVPLIVRYSFLYFFLYRGIILIERFSWKKAQKGRRIENQEYDW